MLSRGEIGVQRYELYGPRLMLTKQGEKLAHEQEEFIDQIEWVSTEVAPKNVKDLERLATVCLLKSDAPAWSDDALARELNRLKPHISIEDAFKGIEEYENLRKRAETSGAIL